MSTDVQSAAPPTGLGWASVCSAKVHRNDGRHVGEPGERVLVSCRGAERGLAGQPGLVCDRCEAALPLVLFDDDLEREPQADVLAGVETVDVQR
jgi:hypothetical protein